MIKNIFVRENIRKASSSILLSARSSLICVTYPVSKMPKKRKACKDKEAAAASEAENDHPVQVTASNVKIRILAKPGAKNNGITDISSEGVGVHIAAPPVDGAANSELVRYMASVLGLRKSDVTLDKGSRSRNKTVVVSGGISREDVLNRLQAHMETTK